EVDDEFDFYGLLDRQVGRLLSLEYASGIEANLVESIAAAGAIAHQAAGQGELTRRGKARQHMAGCHHGKLFRAVVVEGTAEDHDRTDMLLGKSCEGRFEIAIGSGILNNEFQAQRARRPLQVCDHGLDTRKGRVGKNSEPGSIGYALAEYLQSFWP